MQEEIITAIMTAHLTLIGIIMTSFLTKTHALINKRYSSDSWQQRRYDAIQDLRVEEARDYLDLLFTAFQRLAGVGKPGSIFQPNRNIAKTLREIRSLLDVAGTQRFRLDTLNDPVLARLDNELCRTITDERDEIERILGTIETDPRACERMSADGGQALGLLRQMQGRLAELA